MNNVFAMHYKHTESMHNILNVKPVKHNVRLNADKENPDVMLDKFIRRGFIDVIHTIFMCCLMNTFISLYKYAIYRSSSTEFIRGRIQSDF